MIRTNICLAICIFVFMISNYHVSVGQEKRQTVEFDSEELKNALSISASSLVQVGRTAKGKLISKASFDFGKLLTNTQYTAVVTLSNTSPNDVLADFAVSSCGCGKILFPQTGVPRGESVSFPVAFKTPVNSENGKFGFSTTLKKDGREVGRFLFGGDLQANLYIEPQLVLSISKKQTEAFFPMQVSSPIKPEDLMVHLGENARTVDASVVTRNGIALLRVDVPFESYQGRFSSLDVKIEHPDSGTTVASDILVSKKSLVVVSPKVVRFRRKPDSDLFAARLIIRVTDQSLVKSGQNNSFSFKFGDETIESKVTKISKSIFRAQLMLDDEKRRKLNDLESKTVDCSFMIKGRSFKETVLVLGD